MSAVQIAGVFSTTAWGELESFPEILHRHYINCYVTFVNEKSLATLTLARALETSYFSALVSAVKSRDAAQPSSIIRSRNLDSKKICEINSGYELGMFFSYGL